MSVEGRMDYIYPITDNYPPDFNKLEKALNEGLDINIHDDYSEDKDEQETMLSDALDCYGVEDGLKECPYIVDIVKFFLEHGYDVHANEEYNGIHPLYKLAYSLACDKYSIEAAKQLLLAGADTEKDMYEYEKYTSVEYMVSEQESDKRSIDGDFYASNYYYTFGTMISYRKEGKDYTKVYHPDFAIGKRLNGIYVMDGFAKTVGYTGQKHDTTFSKLVLQCEEYMLNISSGIRVVIDPYLEGYAHRTYYDVSRDYQEYVGQKIVGMEYVNKTVPDWSKTITDLVITFENGCKLVVSEDCLNGCRLEVDR